jgi:putative addiction module CopG family antidote
MRTTVALSITLPHKMAAYLRKKVRSGEYASESEVIRESLRDLKHRDETFEERVRSEVLKSVEEYRANPASAIPLEKLAERFAAGASRTKASTKNGRAAVKRPPCRIHGLFTGGRDIEAAFKPRR